MNPWLTFIPVVIAGALTVLGWSAVNRLTERREKRNKARELRVQYLAKACRVFARTGLERSAVPMAKELEDAVADVYLFGTDEQVVLVRKFAQEFAAKQSANLDELLKSLRDELRDELELRRLTENPTLLKITIKNGPNKPLGTTVMTQTPSTTSTAPLSHL